MKSERGIILFIVMVLLSGSAMIGMAALQSSLVDERLAGNFRVSVQAQMTAESTLAALLASDNATERDRYLSTLLDGEDALAVGESRTLRGTEVEALLREGALDQFFSKLLPPNYDELNAEEQTAVRAQLIDSVEMMFERLDDNRVAVAAVDQGLRLGAQGQSRLVFSRDSRVLRSALFNSALVGCSGVQTKGGSTISSYRSTQGEWSGQPGRFAEQDIPLVRTMSEGASMVLGGNEQIHGGIEALGSVELNGSFQVFGTILANRSIYLNAEGGRVKGNALSLEDIVFGNGVRVDSVVSAMQDVHLDRSASIGKGIYAGRDIRTIRNPASDHIDQAYRANFSSRSNIVLNGIEAQPCDTADFAGNSLSDEIQRYQRELTSQGDISVATYPDIEWHFTPQAIARYDSAGDVNRWVSHAAPQANTLFSEPVAIYRVGHLRLIGSPSLRVSGGDVVIVVDGDFAMGGGSGLTIDNDSSLTVFVAGRIDVGNVLNMSESKSLNQQGKPTFSLFSSYSGTDIGVNFNSSTRVIANVYAPYANVSVNLEDDFFGSIRGRSIQVSGKGSIVYDELLMGAFGGAGGNASGGSGGTVGWHLAEWQ